MNVRIEKLDHFGRGITYIDGKICFVEHALPNEIVKLKIIKETKKYYLAEAIDYIEKSLDRCIEKCPYFNSCGGCDLEHYDYMQENIYKQKKVQELLKQFAKAAPKIKNIEYGKESHYRNKITLHGKDNKLGYYKKNSNDLIEITECNLVDKRINVLLPILKNLAKENEIKEVVIRADNDSAKVMVRVIGKIKDYEPLFSYADVLIINDQVVTKDKQIISRIGKRNYYLSIDSFFQVNKDLTEKLYNEVKSVVKEEHPNTVLDLYCGTGTIGIYVSDYAKKVVGVDYSKSNILDANKNKKLNNIQSISFIHSKVEDVITNFHDIDLVIVDPPRNGLDNKTKENLKRINAKTIIYVSCDPSTLMRDLNILKENYAIDYIKPFNMFPRTYHVECVAVLKLK